MAAQIIHTVKHMIVFKSHITHIQRLECKMLGGMLVSFLGRGRGGDSGDSLWSNIFDVVSNIYRRSIHPYRDVNAFVSCTNNTVDGHDSRPSVGNLRSPFFSDKENTIK